MATLKWEQVNRVRVAAQSLLTRAHHDQWLMVVRQICGLHAQLMSSVELSVWSRVEGVTSQEIHDALWEKRTLVKTWSMRGTLHVLAADDFPLYISALSTLKHFRRGSWLKYHGVSITELDAILSAVNHVLSDRGITREQLAEAMAQHTNTPKLRELMLSGWGALLKPTAFQGSLCFGPNNGQNVTFVHPKRWLGEWATIHPDTALIEIARRFLEAYGPATIDEFSRWFGLEPSAAKKVFRGLGNEIVEVNVEGWKAWMIASDIQTIEGLPALSSVRLLPYFDPYTIAVARHCAYLMPEAQKGRVYRQQGWISPVVLVNGRIAGIWEHEVKRSLTQVTVSFFTPQSEEIKNTLEQEAERLGVFLGAPATVAYSE